MPWARITDGAIASASGAIGSPLRRIITHTANAPSVTAPMMPRPPAVMLNACQGFLPSPKYFWWSVITWYRRPPMMPAGMITIAASHTVSGLPPRAL